MKKDSNGKTLEVGDKVHVLGRADKVLYVIELGETTAGVSHDRNATNCYGVKYSRLVKTRDQS